MILATLKKGRKMETRYEGVPFVIDHPHSGIIEVLVPQQARIVHKFGCASKNGANEGKESCFFLNQGDVVFVVHQILISFQERRLVNDRHEEMESCKICINLRICVRIE